MLLPTAFAQTGEVIISSLAIISTALLIFLIYLYFKIQKAHEQISLYESAQKQNSFLDSLAEDMDTHHADFVQETLSKNQRQIQQLKRILRRKQLGKEQLYKQLHPHHKEKLHTSLQHVAQKYHDKYAELEKQEDKEVKKALDSFAKLKEYHSAHKQKNATSFDKIKQRSKR